MFSGENLMDVDVDHLAHNAIAAQPEPKPTQELLPLSHAPFQGIGGLSIPKEHPEFTSEELKALAHSCQEVVELATTPEQLQEAEGKLGRALLAAYAEQAQTVAKRTQRQAEYAASPGKAPGDRLAKAVAGVQLFADPAGVTPKPDSGKTPSLAQRAKAYLDAAKSDPRQDLLSSALLLTEEIKLPASKLQPDRIKTSVQRTIQLLDTAAEPAAAEGDHAAAVAIMRESSKLVDKWHRVYDPIMRKLGEDGARLVLESSTTPFLSAAVASENTCTSALDFLAKLASDDSFAGSVRKLLSDVKPRERGGPSGQWGKGSGKQGGGWSGQRHGGPGKSKHTDPKAHKGKEGGQ